MRVTKKDVKNKFHNCLSVNQIDRKQLFIVEYANYQLLVSYYTIIGVSISDANWQITDEYYSITTTRQRNYFLGEYPGKIIDKNEFADVLMKLY